MTDAVGSVWLAWSGVTRQAVAASVAWPAAARLRIKSPLLWYQIGALHIS